MSFRLGVYDLFSRIAPGGFYLLAFAEFAKVMGWIKYDLETLKDIGILPSLVLLLVAYILGAGMDRIGSQWHRIFKKRGASNRALARFKELHSDHLNFEFKDKDWLILRSYIYIHNPVVAEEIDRFNALAIMERNLSLGLVLLAIDEIIQFINTNNWMFLIFTALLVFLSYQIAIQARNQRDMFYEGVFATIVAYRLDLEDRVKSVKTSKRKNAK